MNDAEYWRGKAERYRLAWLSAKRGRAAWFKLYIELINHYSDRRGLRYLNLAREHSKTIRRLTEELRDYRLAASEAEGEKARDAPSG
jgi:hypothetical protein